MAQIKAYTIPMKNWALIWKRGHFCNRFPKNCMWHTCFACGDFFSPLLTCITKQPVLTFQPVKRSFRFEFLGTVWWVWNFGLQVFFSFQRAAEVVVILYMVVCSCLAMAYFASSSYYHVCVSQCCLSVLICQHLFFFSLTGMLRKRASSLATWGKIWISCHWKRSKF